MKLNGYSTAICNLVEYIKMQAVQTACIFFVLDNISLY